MGLTTLINDTRDWCRSHHPEVVWATALRPDTLPSAWRNSALKYGSRIALTEPPRAGGACLDYASLLNLAAGVAAGLIHLGTDRGAHVALLSENRPEWTICNLGILAAGATPVLLHTYLHTGDVSCILNDCPAETVFVSGAEALERVAACVAKVPHLRNIISFESETARRATRAQKCRVLALADLVRAADADDLGEVKRRLARLQPHDEAAVITTSGTTGCPKGVVLTHRNLAVNSSTTRDLLGFDQATNHLSYLPLSHSYEHNLGHHLMLSAGARINFAQSVENLTKDLRRVRPTTFFSVPYVLRRLWQWGVNLSERYDCSRQEALVEITGGRVKLLVCAGAPLPAELGRNFQSCGFLVREGYGLTETSPVLTFTGRQPRFGTVGRAIPGVRLRIGSDNEIRAHGPNVMKEYRNRPEETALAFDRGGFFRTEDLGRFDDDGNLVITGRKKHLIVLATGHKIHPQPLETLICQDNYVSQAVVVGEGQPYLTALIVPDYARLSRDLDAAVDPLDAPLQAHNSGGWATRLTDSLNRQLTGRPPQEQIRDYWVLPREFSADRNELTPTLKPKRAVILEHHQWRVAALYEKTKAWARTS